jgi:ornithine cyclodeaminase
VIVTATSSVEPVLRYEWLSRGAHVNAVGSSTPSARELDAETMARATVFADRRESFFAESGDFLGAVRDGAVDAELDVAELGEVLAGTRAGRGSEGELTLFESLGLAVEDLAAVEHLYTRARELGRGTRVEL